MKEKSWSDVLGNHEAEDGTRNAESFPLRPFASQKKSGRRQLGGGKPATAQGGDRTVH